MLEKIKRILENPQRKYGIYPIIHHRVLNKELVDENNTNGFAGVVANIEYRQGFDDNDEVWQETADIIRQYIDKGMYVWLYDEDGYPSGVASGYLTEKYPEHIAKGLYCYSSWRPLEGPRKFRSEVPDEKLWRAALVSADGNEVIDITDKLNKNNVLYFDIPEGKYYFIMMSVRRLFDGLHNSESWATPRNYINLFDKKAVGRFIEMTHEKYKKFVGDQFGNGIIATFTDEPSLMTWCLSGIHPYLAWSEELPDLFYQKYGYDYFDACIAVLKGNVISATKKRCGYWEFIADLSAEGYFKQIQDWCHANNLKSSGHFIGEEHLAMHVLAYGSFFRCMKHLDWPGIDMLYTTPEELMDENKIPAGRLAASVADISGENEVFTEYSDLKYKVSKTTAPPEVYYGSTNWHIALGVNNFTSYFSFRDVTSEEKRKFNKYVARCGELMRLGIRDSRTALYYPEPDMWSNFTPTAEFALTGTMGGDEFQKIQKKYRKLTWGLLHRQVDFDYVYNEVLLDGKTVDGALVYKNRRYTNIILSSFNVVEDKMAEKIINMAKDGIKIHVLNGSCHTSRNTGEKSPYADEFAKLVKSGVIFADNDGDVDKLLDNHFDGYIIKADAIQKKLLTHCRITEDGTRIVFAANMGYEDIADKISINEKFTKIYCAYPETGIIEEIDSTQNQNCTTFDLKVGGIKANIYIMER